MGHAIVVDFLVGLPSDTGPEEVKVDIVNLRSAHGHLEYVVLAPWLSHGFLPKCGYPFVDFAEVAVFYWVVRGVVGADPSVREVFSQDVCTLFCFQDAELMLVTAGPVEEIRV
jgi:hypothetical protein